MRRYLKIPPCFWCVIWVHGWLAGALALEPVVEIEEEVYTYQPANNGAGPMWCAGSTCLVRVGPHVFASGLETLPELKPLNNCRWTLFQRGHESWQRITPADSGRTREPSPLAAFFDGRLFLSANPTLLDASAAGGGPARPEIVMVSGRNPEKPPTRMLPVWRGHPQFTEHSYRSFAADAQNGELILFQNIDYTHAEWAFFDRTGQWSAQGQLKWPWGADYEKPQPIRVCYATVAIKDRAVYFCGVSDIVEPNSKWREFKRQLTGREWDYDFRRLFFTWTPDITREPFRDWIEVASREKTAGWIFPADLWVDAGGAVHLLWTERALDERLREKFFPEAKQSHALNYAILESGKVVTRRALVEAAEGGSREVPSAGRFQVTPENKLLVCYYVQGQDVAGRRVLENRLLEIGLRGARGSSVRIPFKKPFTSFFTATVRAGSPPSNTLELLGTQEGKPNTISYGRVPLR
ncbi:MAG: hypothetical protein AB1813_15175 [Verrucomicrobiota bacterium]